MAWIDAYENAAMILSGMGPVADIETKAGKIFSGTYALFSGIIFLVVIAIIFAPVIHRFFINFILKKKSLASQLPIAQGNRLVTDCFQSSHAAN